MTNVTHASHYKRKQTQIGYIRHFGYHNTRKKLYNFEVMGPWVILCFVIKLTLTCLMMFLLAFALYIYYMHCKFSHIQGPPRSNFFLGNLLEIRRRRLVEGKNIHQTLADWSTEYRPIFIIWFFHRPLAIVSDADVVRDVLVVKNLPKDYFGYKRFQYVYGQRFLGSGLFSDLNLLTWERKRRTFAPLFHQSKMFDGFPTLNACCDKFLRRLEKYADGNTEISLADEFLLVTLETILKVGSFLSVCRPSEQ